MITSSEEIMGNYDPLDLLIRLDSALWPSVACVYMCLVYTFTNTPATGHCRSLTMNSRKTCFLQALRLPPDLTDEVTFQLA